MCHAAPIADNARPIESSIASRGGHLVLVFGANRDTGDWLFHNNPSGFDVRTQQNVAMPRATFDRHFANRGILIAP